LCYGEHIIFLKRTIKNTILYLPIKGTSCSCKKPTSPIKKKTHFGGDFGVPNSRLRQMLQRQRQRVQGVAEPGFAGVEPVTVSPCHPKTGWSGGGKPEMDGLRW
jgi:hypothetical protein